MLELPQFPVLDWPQMAFCRDEARGFAMTISHRLACSVVRHGWCWTPIFSESSLSVRQKPLFRETVKPGYGNQPARVQGEKGIGWAWRLGCNAGKWGCWGGTGSSSQVLECVLVGDAFFIFFYIFCYNKDILLQQSKLFWKEIPSCCCLTPGWKAISTYHYYLYYSNMAVVL